MEWLIAGIVWLIRPAPRITRCYTHLLVYLTLQRPVISQCGRVLGLELGQLIDCDPFN